MTLWTVSPSKDVLHSTLGYSLDGKTDHIVGLRSRITTLRWFVVNKDSENHPNFTLIGDTYKDLS